MNTRRYYLGNPADLEALGMHDEAAEINAEGDRRGADEARNRREIERDFKRAEKLAKRQQETKQTNEH